MARILKKSVLALFVLCMFNSCAIHFHFPFICFRKECIYNQWYFPKAGLKIKSIKTKIAVKIHKTKRGRGRHNPEDETVKTPNSSKKRVKSIKKKSVSDSLFTKHEPPIQKTNSDTLSGQTSKTNLIINYPFDDNAITEKEKKEIKKYLESIDIKNISKIAVKGYTDNKGSDAYNKNLSSERAKIVYQYLIELGLPASKLSSEGMGAQNPISDNGTSEGARENRRVELEIN